MKPKRKWFHFSLQEDGVVILTPLFFFSFADKRPDPCSFQWVTGWSFAWTFNQVPISPGSMVRIDYQSIRVEPVTI